MTLALPRVVKVVAAVSLLNEISAQMVAPLIPVLLATVLAAGPLALGVVEGVADAVASLLRLWSGRLADVSRGSRKWLTVGGYALSCFSRPLIALAVSWPFVVVLRSCDRLGKGIRGAPRDAIVADATAVEMRGRAYGLQRAMDYAGAMGGALIAAAVLAYSNLSLAQVITLSAIPGAIVVLLLVIFLNNRDRHPTLQQPGKSIPSLRWSALGARMRLFLPILALFAFARASESFILLRGHELGISTVQLLLLWAALAGIQTLSAYIGGGYADKYAKTNVTTFGWITFAASYAGFAAVGSATGLWIATLVYGLFSGISEGVERALITELATPSESGTAFGWYHMTTGLAAVPAGVLFGAVWQAAGAASAFAMVSVIAAAAAVWLRGQSRHFKPLERIQ